MAGFTVDESPARLEQMAVLGGAAGAADAADAAGPTSVEASAVNAKIDIRFLPPSFAEAGAISVIGGQAVWYTAVPFATALEELPL